MFPSGSTDTHFCLDSLIPIFDSCTSWEEFHIHKTDDTSIYAKIGFKKGMKYRKRAENDKQKPVNY